MHALRNWRLTALQPWRWLGQSLAGAGPALRKRAAAKLCPGSGDAGPSLRHDVLRPGPRVNCRGSAPATASREVTSNGIIIALAAALILLGDAHSASAAGWPSSDNVKAYITRLVSNDPTALTSFDLSTVLNLLKAAGLTITYLIWISSADWVNRDRYHRRADKIWNVAMVVPFAAVFVLWGLLEFCRVGPAFLITYPLLWLAWFVPFLVYVSKRNQQVEMDQRVFTKNHLRYWTSKKLEKIGIKMRSEGMTADDIGPPIKLTARGGATDRDDNVNLLTARQSPGWLPARELLAQGLDNRADAIMLDYTQQAVSVRFQVDGVWHPGEGLERETGDMALAVLKAISALNPNERRARQQGSFGTEYQGKKQTPKLMSQGTQTGERVLIQFPDPEVRKKRSLDLGMREKMWEELKPVLESRSGMVVISAPPGAGLTSLLHALIGGMDRYTRGFVCVEDATLKEVEMENVPVTTFNAAAGEAPLTVLPKLIREYPDVLVVPDMKDAESADLLCDQTGLDRTVITTARAKEASEALLRVMTLKMQPQKYADAVKAAVNVRLVRKLCEKCKEAYAPPPQLLQQLGIPQGRIEALYRPPTPNPEQPQEPCGHCRGIGYLGRTGIFETLIVNDLVRQTLLKKPQVEAVRQAARKAGMRTLQEEGLLLVVTGVTSLPELQRALKET